MISNADKILAVKHVTERVCHKALRLFSCKAREWREIMTAMKKIATIFMAVAIAFAMMPMTAWTVKAADGPIEVSTINVDITHPTAGDSFTNANASNVKVSGEGFTVKQIEWCEDYGYDANNQIIAKENIDHPGQHGVFNPKHSYRLIIKVEAKNGYIFKSQYGLLYFNTINTNIGSIGVRDLSENQKTATIVLIGLYAFTTINVTSPKVDEETAPTVSLPEFEQGWFTITGAQWCDENGDNLCETKTFAEGDTAYMIVHLATKDSKYNWPDPSKAPVNAVGGTCISVSNKTTYDKLDALISVKAGGPCPKGGEHDWKLIYHKASFTDYGYQTAVCSKCGSDEGGMAIGGAPVTTVKLAKDSYVYTGKAIRPAVTLASADGTLNKDYYTLSYSNNTKVGTASVKITLTGEWFEGTKTLTFKITKAANPLAVKPKTASVKFKKLKKKPQTLAVTKLISFTKKADDKKAYTLSSAKKGKKNFKKYFKISKTTGKLTVKKGLKKGTYNLKVSVKASGNSNYQASAAKTVTCKVKVK